MVITPLAVPLIGFYPRLVEPPTRIEWGMFPNELHGRLRTPPVYIDPDPTIWVILYYLGAVS